MTTATADASTTSTDTRPDAKSERAKNLALNGDKALVPVIGNTYPLKGWFYVLGGTWSKDQKCWLIPAHHAAAAQAKADELTKPKASTPKAPSAPAATKPKAAPIAKPKADKPAPVTAPTAPTNIQAAIKRIENLGKAAVAIREELGAQLKVAVEANQPTEKIMDAVATMDVVANFLVKAVEALA